MVIQSYSVTSFRSPFSISKIHLKSPYQIVSRLYSEKAENDQDKGVVEDEDANGEKINEMMKMMVSAIDEGRQQELIKKGLKVVSKTARETLDEKLNDPEVQANILGSMTQDETEMMALLNSQMLLEESSERRIREGEAEIDPALFENIKAEAAAALNAMRSQGGGIAALLNEDEGEEGEPKKEKGKGFAVDSKISNNDYKNLLSQDFYDKITQEQIQMAKEQSGGGSSTELPITQKEEGGGSDAPGYLSDSGREIFNSVTANGSPEPAEVDTASDEYIKSNLKRIAALQEESSKQLKSNEEMSSLVSGITASPVVEGENIMVAETPISAQENFAKLLKETMDQQNSVTVEDDEVIRTTLDAMTQGDMANLDMKSLLGDALSTITAEMGIDMRSELMGSPQSMKDVQGIMANNMAELARNMEELDKESSVLYAQLGNLEADLRQETSNFDQAKSYELEGLLASQNTLQSDLAESRSKLEVSTNQMKNMMSDLEDRADALTALALFSVKSVDKKIAFIVGLALLFKVPFDISQLWAIRSTDFNDWLTIFTQSALCFTCLGHYGLVKAIGNTLNGGQKFVLPPPPDGL